jgi:hypothetical protein
MMADRVALLGELAQPHRIPYQFGSRATREGRSFSADNLMPKFI